MKKLMFLFALLAMNTSIEAHNITDIRTTGKKYVIADSGLKMRVGPNASSSAIKILKYGESLNVVEDSLCYSSMKLGWVTGTWLMVEHNGEVGYVFDGYLTDYEIIDPLDAPEYTMGKAIRLWAISNFAVNQAEDIIYNDYNTETSQTFVNGNHVQIISSDKYELSEMYLREVSVTEAHQIVKSILIGSKNKKLFDTNSIYYTNDWGIVNKIKVTTPFKVEIENQGEFTKITIKEIYEGC